MQYFYYLMLASLVLVISAQQVVDVTEATFDSIVDGSTNVLVEFFAPWCGHCKNLAPEWKLAAETFQADDAIIFAAVDATENSALAQRFGVKGYPTIKFFPKGSTTAEEYDGGRQADTIIKWVNTRVGTSRKLKQVPSAVTTLTSSNFDKVVLGSKAALVEFYAPWCGHCKSLAPKYEKLAQVFAGDSDVVIAKLDATEENEISTKYGITGFPTLKFFPAGSSEPINYESEREVEAMVQFINEKAGTSRLPDGTLLPTTGRMTELDDAIKAANHHVDAALVEKLNKHITSLSDKKVIEYGKIYLSVAEKVISKGADYVAKEITRLHNMIKSPNVAPASKTNFQLKQNILNAFMKE
jgi:protein disulfide-isomerase-like protein